MSSAGQKFRQAVIDEQPLQCADVAAGSCGIPDLGITTILSFEQCHTISEICASQEKFEAINIDKLIGLWVKQVPHDIIGSTERDI